MENTTEVFQNTNYCVCVSMCVLSRVQLFEAPWTVACQAPLSMGFLRQEHWSKLPFSSLGTGISGLYQWFSKWTISVTWKLTMLISDPIWRNSEGGAQQPVSYQIFQVILMQVQVWAPCQSSVVKNLPANAGDVGSIPGSGRCPGEGNGYPLQCSCLRNPMDREA